MDHIAVDGKEEIVKSFNELVDCYYEQYEGLTSGEGMHEAMRGAMPGKAYFLEEGSILSLPREDGDNRFPYGSNGFNFWAYASGYMHANEGLFSPFLRAGEGQEPNIAFFAGWKEKDAYKPLSLLAVPGLEAAGTGQTDRFTVFTKTCAYYITQARKVCFAIRVFVDDANHMYFSVLIKNMGGQAQKLYVSSYFNPYLCNNIHESSENRWFRKAEYLEDKDIRHAHFIFRINEDLSRTLSVTNFGVLNRSIELSEDDCLEDDRSEDNRSRNNHSKGDCPGDSHSEGGCQEGNRLLYQEATTSRYQYVGGVLSSLHTAKALKLAHFDEVRHVTAFNEMAAAGEMLHLELEPGKPVRIDYELGYRIHSRNREEWQGLFHNPERKDIDRMIEQAAVKEDREEQSLTAAFGEGCMESKGYCRRSEEDDREKKEDLTGVEEDLMGLQGGLLTHFFGYLKKQVEFCAKIRGYVQLSENSLIGIRDVFQALEGMLYYRPKEAADKILEALGFIFPDGRCPRQYSLPVNELKPPVMDLRQFIDQGIWIINTITAYLKFTGDFGFLEKCCGYYEIVDEEKETVKKSTIYDSVLTHMQRIMDYLLKNRDTVTGCIRTLYGDWNDALDGLGVSGDGSEEFGSGVSVMATLQVYQNLSDMIELLEHLKTNEEAISKTTQSCQKTKNPYIEGQAIKNSIEAGQATGNPRMERQAMSYDRMVQSYRYIREELKEALLNYAVIKNDKGERRIVHGWGDRRSYFAGSFFDPDGRSRYGLTSNAFWVIGGMYEKDTTFKTTILFAFEHLNSKYGFKTFEPFFEPDTPGVGRIYKLPAGTAENGAVYIHAAAFGVMALFLMGEPKKAWEQLIKLLPFTHEHISCSPYVMPNSYGENRELNIDGESMLDWQTGSSNVVLKLMLRFVFGFLPEYEGFFVQPAAWIPFQNYRFAIDYQGGRIHIDYRNNNTGKRCFTVNGVKQRGSYDASMGIEKLWISRQENGQELWIEIDD